MRTRKDDGGCRFSNAEAPPFRPMSAGAEVWKLCDDDDGGCGGSGGDGDDGAA